LIAISIRAFRSRVSAERKFVTEEVIIFLRVDAY